MNAAALFGSSVWLVFGLGVALVLLGRVPRLVMKNSSTVIGSGNTIQQSNRIDNPEKSPGCDSWLSQAGSICSIVGLGIVILQIFKIIV